MSRRSSLLIGLVCLGLASCTGQGGTGMRPKTTVGAMGGAAAGGLMSSLFTKSPAGVVAGTLLGGLIGGAIGDRLDAADQRYMQKTTVQTLEYQPVGVPMGWRNPDTGRSGTVVATRTFEQPGGKYCREYQQTVVIGGKEERAFGMACREQDGNWKIQ